MHIRPQTARAFLKQIFSETRRIESAMLKSRIGRIGGLHGSGGTARADTSGSTGIGQLLSGQTSQQIPMSRERRPIFGQPATLRLAQSDSQTVTATRGTGEDGNVPLGTRAPISNPGPVFDSIEDAARDVLGQVNPISIDHNEEYAWLFYSDKKTGLVGYTDPVATGFAGAEDIHLKFDSSLGTLVGMGHTHGDYMWQADNGDLRRGYSWLDSFHSDKFSGPVTDPRGRTGPGHLLRALKCPAGRRLQAGAALNHHQARRRANRLMPCRA
jgi:hypothetical protein